MRSIIASLIFICFLYFPSPAQTNQDQQLEQKLGKLLSEQFHPLEPGCEILVAKKGQVVYKKSFGSADMELNVPIQPDMVFKIGSITKQFTAVAILQLVEQGKISLHDSLQKYIKDFPAKGQTITIENLLTHTSGIPDYTQHNYEDDYMERKDFTPKQIIDSFKTFPLEFEPGTKFSYSNSGYFLLGYIIEKVTGRSFQKYLYENIFTPLSLNHTFFDSSGVLIPGRVNGYKKQGSDYKHADYWSSTLAYSAGELISNVEDLYKWHTGLYSYKILRKETLETAFKPLKLKDGTYTGYGYGWFVRDIGGVRSIEHGGAITGFHSNEVYYPAEDIFIATLFNCDCAPIVELSTTVSRLVLGKPLQKQVTVNDKILSTYVGTYSLTSNPKRTIVIKQEGGHLVAKVSGQGTFQLIFQSDTKFQLQNVLDANGEFIKENGRVTKFSVEQNGKFVWVKIE